MAHKTMVSGTERAITSGKTRVSGTEYNISGGKTLISGTEYALPFIKGTPISDLSVGDSVFFEVDGNSTEFIIVQKGKPSSLYDSTCDGVWLMAKYLQGSCAWSTEGVNSYKDSTIHSYINSTWYNTLEERVKTSVISAKIPYWDGDGTSGSLKTGANGLSAKAFALSLREVGYGTASNRPNDGEPLEFFKNATNADRVAYPSANATGSYGYWVRTIVLNTANKAFSVGSSFGSYTVTSNDYTRPIFILPHDFEIYEEE